VDVNKNNLNEIKKSKVLIGASLDKDVKADQHYNEIPSWKKYFAPLFFMFPFGENALIIYLLLQMGKKGGDQVIVYYLLIFFPARYIWLYLKDLYRLVKSHQHARTVQGQYRTMGFAGPVGAGKTSLSYYLISLLTKGEKNWKQTLYSSLPVKIRGQYAYEFKLGHLKADYGLNENAKAHVDEITMGFDNTYPASNTTIKKIRKHIQLWRQAWNGYFYITSVSIDRVHKYIEEQLFYIFLGIGQERRYYSLFSRYFSRLLGFDISIRVWHVIEANNTGVENINFNLDIDKIDVKDAENLAGHYAYYSLNQFISFEYDDRYFAPPFKNLPKKNIRWDKLTYDPKHLKDSVYNGLFKDLPHIFNDNESEE